MFQGSVDLEHARHERPAWVARLEKQRKLQQVLVADVSGARRALFYIFGYAVIAVSLYLLIGGLLNIRSITW